MSRIRVPTPVDLWLILGAADLRARAVISLMTFSGFTIYGIRAINICDLNFVSGTIEFSRIPATIRAYSRHKPHPLYSTHLSNEGCEHVIRYLKTRVGKKGNDSLSPSRRLFVPTSDFYNIVWGRAIILQDIMKAIRKTGFPFPIIFTSPDEPVKQIHAMFVGYFKTRLNEAGADRKFTDFWGDSIPRPAVPNDGWEVYRDAARALVPVSPDWKIKPLSSATEKKS